MCELVRRMLFIDGSPRLDTTPVQCTSEFGKLMGELVCAEPAAWSLTVDFGAEGAVRAYCCHRHYMNVFTGRQKCPWHHEPYTVVNPAPPDVGGRY